MTTPSPDTGFCVHVRRLRVEQRPNHVPRTVGEYQCLWWGQPIAGLSGQMVECGGPGDNTDEIGDELDRRVTAGSYPLAVHASFKYRTFGYTANIDTKAKPRPALRLDSTHEREGILIHPSSGYIWSTGCLNPCSGLQHPGSNIDYRDSRSRVIAIIDGLAACLGARMPRRPDAAIPEAHVWIEGEPR